MLAPTSVFSQIRVIVYDFISHAGDPDVEWQSGAGILPFPGSDGDRRGFALWRDNVVLENGVAYGTHVTDTRGHVLVTYPQMVSDGWIQGVYPARVRQPNPGYDLYLCVSVGFLQDARTDGATFKVFFQEGELTGSMQTYPLMDIPATDDNRLDSACIDVSYLAGKTGRFYLEVHAGQNWQQDWAASVSAQVDMRQHAAANLELNYVEPVQVLYGAPLLVKLKGTVFRAHVLSTFQNPVTAEFRLELPESEWSIPQGYRLVDGDLLLPREGWTYPEVWGPVTLNPGDNDVIIPTVPAGMESSSFDPDSNPAGINVGACSLPPNEWCHPDTRVVPIPVSDQVSFTVTVNPRRIVAETDWSDNRYSGVAFARPGKMWRFLFFPTTGGVYGTNIPRVDYVESGAKRQLEHLLGRFPIPDRKITYTINDNYLGTTSTGGILRAYSTVWQENEDFFSRIANEAILAGYDIAVAIGQTGGGQSVAGYTGAVWIEDCSGLECLVLTHEFNHATSGMEDIYSYYPCPWEVPYCELPDGQWEVYVTGDCDYSCSYVTDWTTCQNWCQTFKHGYLYACPDGRNFVPASDGFWVNKWLPRGSENSVYFMAGCTGPWGEGSCTGSVVETHIYDWARLGSVRECVDTGECGHHIPGGAIVYGDIGDAGFHAGIERDGYRLLLYSPNFYSEYDPEVLLVSGTINKNSTVLLNHFYHLTNASLDILLGGEGDYYLVLLDHDRNILSKSGFKPSFYLTGPNGGPVSQVPFIYRVEWKSGTERIEVWDKDGKTLATRNVSANKPDVQVTYPNGGEVLQKGRNYTISWNASDRDGDPLTYSVLTSKNNGNTWLPVATDIAESEYQLNTAGLTEGESYRVKVIATDGVNTAEDISDSAFSLRTALEEVTATTATTKKTTELGAKPCVVATAAYGSEMENELAYMRYVRDRMIGSNDVGRALVEMWNAFYYSWSPPIAEFISTHSALRPGFRASLFPIIMIVHGTAYVYSALSPTNPALASVAGFIFAASASATTYLITPLLVVRFVCRRARTRRSAL